MKRILFLVLILILLSNFVWSERTEYTGYHWAVWNKATKEIFVSGFLAATYWEDFTAYDSFIVIQIPVKLVVAEVDEIYCDLDKRPLRVDGAIYVALVDIHWLVCFQLKESEENKGL